MWGKATPSAGRHGVACEAVPQGMRSSGNDEAIHGRGNGLDRLHEVQPVRVSRAGASESKDRGLSGDNLRNDNAAARQKNKQEGLMIDERWYESAPDGRSC